jgi:hypothetical protein
MVTKRATFQNTFSLINLSCFQQCAVFSSKCWFDVWKIFTSKCSNLLLLSIIRISFCIIIIVIYECTGLHYVTESSYYNVLTTCRNFSLLLLCGCFKGVHLLHYSPLWSTGQSSWLHIQRSGLKSRLYQIFWEVVGLERGPFSLVSTTEELLGRKSSGSGLEIREYSPKDPSSWPQETLYPQ